MAVRSTVPTASPVRVTWTARNMRARAMPMALTDGTVGVAAGAGALA
ncbi:MAG: hypothetical protein H2056_01385 [Sphingopyxis sp.]|nr:hypothetical protein [Sphingopyxis sp.]